MLYIATIYMKFRVTQLVYKYYACTNQGGIILYLLYLITVKINIWHCLTITYYDENNMYNHY